jgi:hypothetical protein
VAKLKEEMDVAGGKGMGDMDKKDLLSVRMKANTIRIDTPHQSRTSSLAS